MRIFAIMVYDLLVKRLIYKHLIVGSLALVVGCSPSNRFADAEVRMVYDARDQRNLELLYSYLDDSDPTIRLEAARAFGSIPDSGHTARLVAHFVKEKEEDIRIQLAFSIGQTASYQSSRKLLSQWNEQWSDPLKRNFLIALGKCGHSDYLLDKVSKIENPDNYWYEALFYAARAGKLKQANAPAILLKNKDLSKEASFFSAWALLRSGLTLQPNKSEILELLEDESQVNTRFALIQCLGKCDSSVVTFLEKLYAEKQNHDDYLERLAIAKSLRRLHSDLSNLLLLKCLTDKSFHVRDAASEILLEKKPDFPAIKLKKLANEESFLLVRCRILESLFYANDFNAYDSLSRELRLLYRTQKDEYQKGMILQALTGSFDNLAFIEEEMYSTPSILIREHAFSALLKYRRSKNFMQFSTQFKSISNQLLSDHFAQVFQDAIKTHDVSMVSLAAEILRDTTLLDKAPGNIPVRYNDISFMHKALSSLILPRDIEAYGELLKTIRLYEGKPVEGNLKAEYNNPIDWDYVMRIPQKQQVEIKTSQGAVVVELWVETAPSTVAWFMKLIEKDFYTAKRLHRVVPGFVIQDGCPRGDGYGSTPETIRSEFSDQPFEAGVIGMASAGPDTESCQWFITHTDTPHLNGRYTAFGKVVSGMDHVHALQLGDAIESIRLLP